MAMAAFLAGVEEVFNQNARVFFMIFDYYATLGSSDDMFHVCLAGLRSKANGTLTYPRPLISIRLPPTPVHCSVLVGMTHV